MLPVSARTLRVGVYDNPPKVYMDDNGRAAGVFMDLLRAIALEEGWTLEPVAVSWPEGLRMVQENELDIMPDVAKTPDRMRILDFHSTFALTAWSQVYSRQTVRVERLGDLNGRRVAVLRDSVQHEVLSRLGRGFDLMITLLPADSFDEAFRKVVANDADMVVVNQFYGDKVYERHGLRKSPVILNPVGLYFVTGRGRNADVLDAIDRHIQDWQNRGDSPFFQVLAHWIDLNEPVRIPRWISGIMLALALGLSGFVCFTSIMRTKIDEAVASLREANERLLQNERKWRSYIDHAPYAIFIVDEQGSYQEVNTMACKMTGYSEQEFLGKTLAMLVAEGSRKSAENHFRSLHDEGMMDTEIQLRKKSGELFWVRICANRIEDNLYIGFLENIQAIKEARKEQLRLQAELIHAHKLDAVGRLAGGIAHDYNNMLGVILGGCELMRMKMPEDAPEIEDLNHIYDAATRSVRITRQLLAFSRKQEPCPVVVNLNEAVSELNVLIENLIEKDIRILWDLCDRPLPVRIDTTFVDQVLMNLCVNARDALAGPGEIRIRTDSRFIPERTFPEIESGVYACLHVKDNGPGMDPGMRDRIFEPFFTTKPINKGTGMGLATVYGLVKQAGGFIRVSSEPGKGTAFEIGLPLLSEDEDGCARF